MKIEFYMLVLASGLFLGLKEDAGNKQVSPVTKKLFQTSMKGGQLIQYNRDGKPAVITWKHADYSYSKKFYYSTGSISYTVLMNDEKIEQGEYKISNGKIITLNWFGFGNDGKPKNPNKEFYYYNERGLLNKHQFNDVYSTYMYNEDGDLIKTTHYNSKGVPGTSIEYQYSSYKDLSPAIGYFNADGSGFFFPPFAKHLVAAKKVKRSTGEITLYGKFKYDIDADGYACRIKWAALTPGDLNYEWTNSFQ